MRKWMFELLSKSESCGNKIDRVNSIRITKSITLLLFLTFVEVRCSVKILKLIASAQSIYRDVCGVNIFWRQICRERRFLI